uniref:Putative e3 ubiquitin-protein ligase n=1 Tax=Ixodes ricinus TaxID=34613 RepID=A0A6B0UZD0_IXORI
MLVYIVYFYSFLFRFGLSYLYLFRFSRYSLDGWPHWSRPESNLIRARFLPLSSCFVVGRRKISGKSRFQGAWLYSDEYKDRVAPDTTNQHRARCKPCGKTFDVAAIGESALKSHMKSAKHASIMKIAANSSVHNYLAPGTSERSTVPPPPQLPNLCTGCCHGAQAIPNGVSNR